VSERPAWDIRRLKREDLPVLRPVRLAALQAHPEAFGSSYEEEQAGGPGNDMTRLIGEPPSVMLGGFVAGQLVATACLTVSARIKQRHKGHLTAVYVAPAWRGSGLGGALLDAVVAHARAVGLLTVTLSVTVGNAAARSRYLRAGFESYGSEPGSLRIGAALLDEELMVLRLD
jgi:ribosomal protein S18 acetylase RimI-like enzyme